MAVEKSVEDVLKKLGAKYQRLESQVYKHNKHIFKHNHITTIYRLGSTVKINYKSRALGFPHYNQGEDPSGNENCCQAKGFTCYGDCKWFKEFGLAHVLLSLSHRGRLKTTGCGDF